MNRYYALGAAVLIIIMLGAYFMFRARAGAPGAPQAATEQPTSQNPEPPPVDTEMTVIGKSIEGRDIAAYHYGSGNKEILFVGDLHGGYEWNTALVAYQLIDYLQTNPTAIPANVKVTVIPVANPDGLAKVVGGTGTFAATDVNPSQSAQVAGRYNANSVDLNRNFDCDWQASGMWQTKKVSGGTSAFSEPESQAMKAYVETAKPAAVVVWYSSAGGVFSSDCHGAMLPETKALTNLFAQASGYPAHDVFNYYAITGDMVNWLAKMQIPAVSVLLTNHTDTEWDKNQKGVDAVLQHYAQ